MIKLHQQVEKQQEIKQKIKKTKSWLSSCLVLLLIILLFDLCFCLLVKPQSLILICVATIFVVCVIILVALIVYFIRYFQLSNISRQIIQSIERIIESTLETHLCEDSFAFIDCYKHNDNFFYFSIEIYDDIISYDTLEIILKPLSREINGIIQETFISLYRIVRCDNM